MPDASTIPVVYFCGCIGRPGHYTWKSHSPGQRFRVPYGEPLKGPWPHLDRQWEHPNPCRQGDSSLHRRSGWTALAVTDFTIDSRPGSWAIFAVPVTLAFEEMLIAARLAYPDIVERIGPIAVPKEPD